MGIYLNTEGQDLEKQELAAVCGCFALLQVLELGLYLAIPEKQCCVSVGWSSAGTLVQLHVGFVL